MAGHAPTAVDTTVSFLGEAIIDGGYRAGDQLVEGEVAARYDISRSTARAALLVLAARGLVTLSPGQSARVVALSDDDAVSLYRVRSAVEPMLIHKFTERATVPQVAALDRAMEVFAETARASEDLRRIHRLRDGFYEVLFDGAASTTLEQTVRGEYARLGVYRRQRLSRGQELTRIRINAATICRVVPRIVRRECSAASLFSHRMLHEDGAATLRALQSVG